MNSVVRVALLLLLAIAAILIWQKPASAPTPAKVRLAVPVQPATDNNQKISSSELWRVVTRRVISKDAIYTLTRRLKAMGLEPITIRHQEAVTMHAFDDAQLYTTRKAAWEGSKIWRDNGIEVTIIKAQKDIFLVGLGRFYQANYTEEMQKKLREIGKAFRYQQRTVPIPTIRFTFAPMQKADAEKLWQKLNDSGVMMPVQIPEMKFQMLYGSGE